MRDFSWDSLFILLGVVASLSVIGGVALRGCALDKEGDRAKAAAITECVKAGRAPLECKAAHSREIP